MMHACRRSLLELHDRVSCDGVDSVIRHLSKDTPTFFPRPPSCGKVETRGKGFAAVSSERLGRRRDVLMLSSPCAEQDKAGAAGGLAGGAAARLRQ